MKTDTAICQAAMNILVQTFGPLDTERFISMVKRDTFDYTEWRRTQWNDITIDEMYTAAAGLRSAAAETMPSQQP
jgi:hypothetical protein